MSVRQVKEYDTADGKRYRVRYRNGGQETSETFRRRIDSETFRDILGNSSEDRVSRALAWLRSQQDGARQTITFAEWFEIYVDQLTGVTDRTRSDYRSLKRRYLTGLDQIPVELIGRSHVTAIVNRMDRAGRAPKTIKQAIHLLSTCLSLAIDEGHITANPCKRVRLPSQQVGGHEVRFLSYEEAGRLVQALPSHYRPLIVFLLGTGLRWSEATALEARHVDLANGTVRVEQAWKRVPGADFKIGPPKSRKSNRTVNAGVLALAAVTPLLRGPRDFVFITRSGGPVRHANFYNNIWRNACVVAGLDPAPRIHDTRSTHASWLISDGISLEAVQDQLGHESIETTRKVYARLLPALGVAVGRAASSALEQALTQDPQIGVTVALGSTGSSDQRADS